MIMASPLMGRTPACLSCIRRINYVASSSSLALTQQVRGKKTKSTVVVRLLEDVVKYGKQGAIFPIHASMMRNDFYPLSKAEYMTKERMKELGVTKDDIGERDTGFGVTKVFEEEHIGDAVEHVAGMTLPEGYESVPSIEAGAAHPEHYVPAMEVEQLPANRALELLQTLIPDPIIFEKRMIHPNALKKPEPKQAEPTPAPAPEPEPEPEPAPIPEATSTPESAATDTNKVLSPLQKRRLQLAADAVAQSKRQAAAAAAAVQADKAKDTPATSPLDVPAEEEQTPDDVVRARKQTERDAAESLKIHGSVSLAHIANFLKDTMRMDPEASRINVLPEDVRFVGGLNAEEEEAGTVDAVRRIGSFEVEIRTHVGKAPVEAVRRKVEVVPWSDE